MWCLWIVFPRRRIPDEFLTELLERMNFEVFFCPLQAALCEKATQHIETMMQTGRQEVAKLKAELAYLMADKMQVIEWFQCVMTFSRNVHHDGLTSKNDSVLGS